MLVRKMQIIRKPRMFAAAACSVACVAALAVPTVAFADDYASKQAEAEAALQSLNNIMIRMDEASSEYTAACQKQADAQAKVDEAQTTIDQKTEEIAGLQKKLGTRARSMYRTGNSTFLDVLFDSTTFDEFATNLDLLNSMNQKDADMVSETKTAREDLELAKASYEEETERAAEEAANAQAALEEIDAQRAAAQETYNNLSNEAAQILAAQTAAAAAAAESSYQGVDEAFIEAAAAGGEEVVQEQTIAQDDIVSYDEGSGTATLSDGSQATVVGYDGSGNAIVERAYSALGSNYVWGGVGGGDGGYDCSGLVSYALSGSNTRLGTTGTFIGWNQVSDPQPGDVCVVHNGTSQHTGIYIGDGQMIHAADESTGVVIGDVQSGMVYVRP